jgi:hypothetical protein
MIPRLIAFHAGHYTVHFATGLFFAALALFKRSDQRPLPA